MAIATNSFSTFDQIGIKENVSNIINNISPGETPFYSMLKKFPVSNRLYQWQTDSLAVPASNATIEGDVVTATAAVATVLLDNRTQISTKTLSVTDTAQAVATYGRGDEYEYQVVKRGKELKTDVEFALIKNTPKDAGSVGTARVTGGFCTYITNVVNGTANITYSGRGTTALTPATATSALTYNLVATAMTAAYTAGGNPQYMMMPPLLKRAFSALAFSATPSTADVRYNLTNDKPAAAIGTVDRYLSDFGMLDVMINRVQARQTTDTTVLSKSIFFIDPRYVRCGILQDYTVVPLAKRGLADEAFIRQEYVLEVGAPDAHAIAIGFNQ